MADVPDRVAVVTGTSSGIGATLAQQLLERGWLVLGISRRPGPVKHAHYSHLRLDLADTAASIAAVDAEVGSLASHPATRRVALVNSAAHVGLLGTVERLEVSELPAVFAINTVTPMALMGWVLRRSLPGAALRIVNVSTAAAVQGFPGCGAYGSSKAALRMAGQVLAAELDAVHAEGSPRRDVTILSFEPGMVDTEMQVAVRSSSPELLPMVDFFRQAAAEGHLLAASVPATTIADYLDGDGHPTFVERRQE